MFPKELPNCFGAYYGGPSSGGRLSRHVSGPVLLGLAVEMDQAGERRGAPSRRRGRRRLRGAAVLAPHPGSEPGPRPDDDTLDALLLGLTDDASTLSTLSNATLASQTVPAATLQKPVPAAGPAVRETARRPVPLSRRRHTTHDLAEPVLNITYTLPSRPKKHKAAPVAPSMAAKAPSGLRKKGGGTAARTGQRALAKSDGMRKVDRQRAIRDSGRYI